MTEIPNTYALRIAELEARLELSERVCEAAEAVFGESPTAHDATQIRQALEAWRKGRKK